MAEAVLLNVAQGILNTLGSHTDSGNSPRLVIKFNTGLHSSKDAMRDTENLLDDFSIEAARQKVMRGSNVSKEVRVFFSCSNQLDYGRKMAHRIRDMRTRLDEIAASRKFHLVEHPLEGRAVPEDRRQIVVGREADMDGCNSGVEDLKQLQELFCHVGSLKSRLCI